MAPCDFFVSYARPDQAWAEWIAWTLGQAGYRVAVQVWDFLPGQNFIVQMNAALEKSARTIAVLSDSYLRSPFTEMEWTAALAKGAGGVNRPLIPVRIEACDPPPLLKLQIYVDLVGLPEPAPARSRLLDAISSITGRPTKAAPSASLPSEPPYPGGTASASAPRIELGPDQDPFRVGVVVDGRYEILSSLGRGSMGCAFRALDGLLQTEVVLKFPHEELLAEDPQFRKLFLREARLLAKVQHGAIVKINDFNERGPLPFLVMQYLDGGSLRDRLASAPGRPRARDLVPWLVRMGDALDAIHDAGLVHRDVKPDNVLFDAAGHAFLTDFGIARAPEGAAPSLRASWLEGLENPIGPVAYMAPEQIERAPLDGRADQYALATVAYEALARRLPFIEPSLPLLRVAKRSREAPRLADLEPPLAADARAVSDVLAQALARRPNERFSRCGEFVRAFQAAAERGQPFPWGPVAVGVATLAGAGACARLLDDGLMPALACLLAGCAALLLFVRRGL